MKLKELNNLRESEILINEINTLESILGRLSDLKYGDKVRAIEIAEANNNYQHAALTVICLISWALTISGIICYLVTYFRLYDVL